MARRGAKQSTFWVALLGVSAVGGGLVALSAWRDEHAAKPPVAPAAAAAAAKPPPPAGKPDAGRQFPPRRELKFAESAWTVGADTVDGHQRVLRLNGGLAAISGHPEFPTCVRIKVALREPTENGLPSPAENLELDDLGGALAALEQENESLLAAVVTTNGTKEWIYYTADAAAVSMHIDDLKKTVTHHELHVVVTDDPTWTIYAELSAK